MRMICIKPSRKADHIGKVLHPQQSCARMCRAILLGIVQKLAKMEGIF
jgi:hypothetical protein